MKNRNVILVLVGIALFHGGRAPARGESLAGTAGPGARFFLSRDGAVRLGTHLEVVMSATSDAAVFSELFQRFPEDLPKPQGLDAQTRAWTFGPIRVLQRTWTWEGIPVNGLSVTVNLDHAGHLRVISAPGLGYGAARQLTPEVSGEVARARAAALLHEEIGLEPLEARERLELLATRDGLFCSWNVGLVLPPPFRPVAVRIDGMTGDVVAILPGAADAAPLSAAPLPAAPLPAAPLPAAPLPAAPLPAAGTAAWGSIFEDSFLDGDTVEVSLEELDGSGTLTGSYANVWQYDLDNPPTYLSQTPGSQSGGTWYFDFTPIEEYTDSGPTQETQTDAFAEVMMYYHIDRVHGFFNQLGYYNDDPAVGIDRSMQAIVNYRSLLGYYDNAYYSYASGNVPGQIVFGQGEATDFSYDSSVIYHEYGHAVVNGSSDYAFYCTNDIYGSDCTQGGLNEGTADYFSATLRGDPEIGAYALGEWLPEYARNLTDPHRCPDDLYGEEHEDGKIWGGGLWDVRTAVAGNDTETANSTIDPVILATVTTPLSDDTAAGSAFSMAASILLTDAEIAFGNGSSAVGAVQSALTARGLLSCDRFVPLGTADARDGAFSTATRPGRQSVTVAGLQYVVDIPDSASSFTFAVTSEAGLDKLTLYARVDAPIAFSYGANGVSGVDADIEVSGTSFTLDAASSPPLEPGRSYYVTFSSPQTLSTALWGHYYSVQTTVAGAYNSDENVAHGCGCTQSGTGHSPPGEWLLLVPLVAVLWRRGVISPGEEKPGQP